MSLSNFIGHSSLRAGWLVDFVKPAVLLLIHPSDTNDCSFSSPCMHLLKSMIHFVYPQACMNGSLEARGQRHPQQILEELDKLLETNPLLPSYNDGTNDPDYTIQHKHTQKLCSKSRERNISYVVEQASAMIDEDKKTTFCICSIGCGDGHFDKEVLTQLLRKYPHLDVQYVGLDVNEFSCQTAREVLGSLEGVQIKILAKDIQHASPDDFEPCDLVIAVHVLYYVESLKAAISCALKVVEPNGCLMMINGQRYPLSEICHRFWLHEHKRRLWYTQDIEEALTEMGLVYRIQKSDGPLDFPPNFEKEFQRIQNT